jgi:Tfp pilus assembly PilM family ATPase
VPRGTAVCTLASPAIDIFPLHLPPAEPGAMEAQIVAQAQAQLSYPLASAVLDYSVLPESVRRPVSASVPVLVFAAPRELVERLLGRLDAIGLVVERLLTPACVLAPQVCADAIRGRHLLVATGEEATSISVVQEGAVLLERMSPWGTAQLIEQLRDELGLSAGQCRSLLTPDRPEAAGDGTPSGDPSLQSAMQEILGPIFQSLAQETAGCLGYCDAFLNHEPPVSVIVSGALGRHPLLREALGRDLELPLCGALECLPGTGFGSPDEVCTYAAAIGGALWAEGAAA